MGTFKFGPRIKQGFRYTEKEKVTQRGDDAAVPQLPTAELGSVVPYLIGQVRVFKPNIIWYGPLEPVEEVSKSSDTVCQTTYEKQPIEINTYVATENCVETITTTKTIVGYNISLALGLCMGPLVELRKIYLNDLVWKSFAFGLGGSDGVESSSAQELGTFDIYPGDFDQGINAKITAGTENPEASVGGMPGIAYVFFDQLPAEALGKYRMSFEVRRRPNPLGLSSSVNNINEDINVASAIYDFLTSDWGGMGISTDRIDTTTFTAAATQLAAEENGCSFMLTEKRSATDVLDMLMDQANAIVYENPNTGKIEMKLIRYADYKNATTSLTERSISRVNLFERETWAQTFNKIELEFTNRDKNYTPDVVVSYNYNSTGEGLNEDRSLKINYPAVTEPQTAVNLLTRETQQRSQPSIRTQVVVDRSAATLLPGDPVNIHLTRHLIEPFTGVVLRVGRHKLTDNKVTLDVRQVQRDDIELPYAAQDGGLSDDISFIRLPPTDLIALQAPYFLAVRRGISQSSLYNNDYMLPLLFPTPADTVQTDFRAYITNKTGYSGQNIQILDSGDYPTIGALSSGIGKYDDFSDMVIASIDIESVTNPGYLESVGETGVRNGEFLMFINDEILGAETVTNNGDGTYTLGTVHRMLLDTAPQAHTAGDTVVIIANGVRNTGTGPEPYPLGYTPNFRLVSRVAGVFDEFGDPTDSTERFDDTGDLDLTYNRLAQSYRPVAISLTTPAYGRPTDATVDDDTRIITGDTLAVTYKIRNRTAASITLWADAAETDEIDFNNEINVQYELNMKGTDDVEVAVTGAATDGETDDVNSLSGTVPAGVKEGLCRVYVKAINDVGESIWHEEPLVIKFDTGWWITEDETAEWVTEDGVYVWAGE